MILFSLLGITVSFDWNSGLSISKGDAVNTPKGLVDISGDGQSGLGLQPVLLSLRAKDQTVALSGLLNKKYYDTSSGDFITLFLLDDGTFEICYSGAGNSGKGGIVIYPDGKTEVGGPLQIDGSQNAFTASLDVVQDGNVNSLVVLPGVTYGVVPVVLGTPRLASDPDTTSWGASQGGRMWFNTTTSSMNYWDGTSVKKIANQ